MVGAVLAAVACVGAAGLWGGGVHAAEPAKTPVRVGLLVTGSTSDGGWNALAADSLNKLAKDSGGTITPLVRQQVSKDAAADTIRQFESRGYTALIAHGYEYLDVVKELTDPAKPNAVKMKIAVSGGDVDSPHFQSLFYDLSQASYQLGVIAGKVSKTGKIAFVGGAPFPTVTSMKRGFEAGAKSVNPNITVAEQYTGWDDPGKAKKQVEAFIGQGCDVIMQNVDAASSGVFEAVKEHNARNKILPIDIKNPPVWVYTFGANSDQNGNAAASEYTLASAVIKMDKAFGDFVKTVQAGTFKGGVVKEDIASGVSVAVLNPRLVGKVIDEATQKLVDEAGKKLAAGEIKIPTQ
jgi:basic membrane protein A